MKQTLIVIKETYLRHVKSWSFVFMVISPFIFVGLSLGVAYLSSMSSSNSSRVAVVSNNAQVKEVLKDTKNLDINYKDEATAKKAVKDGNVGGYLLVSEAEGQIKATYFADTSMSSAIKIEITQKLMRLQQVTNIRQANLSANQVKLLSRAIDFKEEIDEKKEGLKMVQTMVAGGIGFLLYIILIFYSSITAQEVASEKGTKIMEVVFSSIRATHYFYARMIGLFGVIFTHIGIYAVGLGGVWIFRDSIPLVKDILSPDSPITQHIGQSISLNTFFFIILGIFMYVVLSAFLGSTVARPEDTGKAISPLMMLVMVGFFGVTALGSAGDVPLLKIGSYIPFISTFFMPFRTINGYASGLESWGSFGIALAFTLLGTMIIGKIYSSLILQTDDLGLVKTVKKALSYR